LLEILSDIAKRLRYDFCGCTRWHVLLAVDQAGWHTSDPVILPDGLHLEFLPAYSPELQPAERLWSILDQPIANRTLDTIEHLEQAFANVNDNYSSGVHIKDSLG
jgi:hypothetical protein